MASFEVFQGQDGDWRFRVRADNGEVVAQSEAYASKENATRATVDLVGVVLKAKATPVKYA
jgi:uncharacterized protein YegP (UPF0339 family)